MATCPVAVMEHGVLGLLYVKLLKASLHVYKAISRTKATFLTLSTYCNDSAPVELLTQTSHYSGKFNYSSNFDSVLKLAQSKS